MAARPSQVSTNIRSPLFPPTGKYAKVVLGAATFAAAPSGPGFTEPDWIISCSEDLFPLSLNCLQHARGGHLTSEELLELGDKVGHQLSGFW